jgi:glycosyltransferase involved in cell wall biosynthesis
MRVCITHDHRFFQSPDGQIWTVTQCPYEFFLSYLEVFDSVRVISRAFPVARVEPNFQRVEGPGVEFCGIPAYKGPYEFLAKYSHVKASAKDAVPNDSATILRVHGQIANSVEDWLLHRKMPYALEVVADPYDVFSPAANKHPTAPIARIYFTRRLKEQCRRAMAVSYVTRDYLQQRYSTTPDRSSTEQYSTAVSDVNLTAECYGSARGPTIAEYPRIIFVGTLESLYKGPDTLIDAVGLCKKRGYEFRLAFLGIGNLQHTLAARCISNRIEKQTEFLGAVGVGAPVRAELDKSDIFVLPSRAEGVPRAMLEAMARGLPCIGSTAGGIPELLSAEDLVPPNDPVALADKLIELLSNGKRLRAMSVRNLAKAAGYSAAVLSERRREFYRAVKTLTKEHLPSALNS